jgi:uncharacterized protein YecE (DUF72 family)
LQYYIGCSGWSYSSWQGPFYPPNIENSQWPRYYSQVFDYVEIDSTFYRMPNPFMVKNWYKRTPDNFRFTAKFPNEEEDVTAVYSNEEEDVVTTNDNNREITWYTSDGKPLYYD